MNEVEFSELIDCNFPYIPREKAIELIDFAISTSTNAMFVVLEELCRPGYGTGVSKGILLDLVDVWSERVDHPLAQSVVPAARMMVKGANLSVNEAINLAKIIAPFKGQYSALNIAYFSCDDTEGSMEIVCQEIRERWDNS